MIKKLFVLQLRGKKEKLLRLETIGRCKMTAKFLNYLKVIEFLFLYEMTGKFQKFFECDLIF